MCSPAGMRSPRVGRDRPGATSLEIPERRAFWSIPNRFENHQSPGAQGDHSDCQDKTLNIDHCGKTHTATLSPHLVADRRN